MAGGAKEPLVYSKWVLMIYNGCQIYFILIFGEGSQAATIESNPSKILFLFSGSSYPSVRKNSAKLNCIIPKIKKEILISKEG